MVFDPFRQPGGLYRVHLPFTGNPAMRDDRTPKRRDDITTGFW
jgi:hypothetical protein